MQRKGANPGGEWRGAWGWAGIVPAPTLLGAMGIGPLTETRGALLCRTAIRLAVLASGVWNARCKLVQEVEKGNGVHERKVRAQRPGWIMPRFGMAAPRGRPPKDRDDLSQTYRRIKESAEHRAQAKAEHEDWRHHHEEWLRARMQAEREARDRRGEDSVAPGQHPWIAGHHASQPHEGHVTDPGCT